MKKQLISAGIRQAFLLGGALTFSQPLLAAESTNPALQALFDQAAYWHQKAHDDLAKASLQKILMVEPNNTQALYLLALYSQQSGSAADAAQWRARLSAVSPNDPHLTALDNAQQMQSRFRRRSSRWRVSRRGAVTSPPRWRPGAAPLAATSRRRAWRRNIT